APAVSPWLAVLVTVVVVPLLWIAARKTLAALDMRPAQDLNRLIGAVGEARTAIMPEGTVYVGGENWSARSREPITRSTRVRVLRREGLILEVEALPAEGPQSQP
ncbi:MAG TPA: NfeD family protein, partial [Anaerolineaceae bacterium]